MTKKLILSSVIIVFFCLSCTKDDASNSDSSVTPQSLAEEIAEIIKQPYSNLTPSQQKVKMEAEANDMLVQMDKSKTSGAIEAMQNLENLLNLGNSIDLFNGKNDNKIEDILNISGVYAVYTWNNSKQDWVKSNSTSELKFVFPAKKSQTSNNASFSSEGTSSNIKVEIEDTYGDWVYDPKVDDYIQTQSINDYFYLPTSVDAILTIDNAQAATFATSAKYNGTEEVPVEASYKMVLNDGYTFEISGGKKATENFAKSSFSYNGKNLISFNAGSTADIDALIEDEDLTQYLGKANGLIQIMDNFLIVADMDIAGLASDEDASALNNPYPNYSNPISTYYSNLNTYYKTYSNDAVASFNKNIKMALVSKIDGTKIADIFERSEKDYAYYNNGILVQYYDEVLYLKFNDNTEVEMSAYFSTGFEDLEDKFEDFLEAFER